MLSELIMSLLKTYYICTKCETIEKENNWKVDESDSFVCIHCDALNEKMIWPPKEVETMLGFILTYDDGLPEYGQITSVFMSAVLELLLEELLYTMAYFDLSFDEASILVDALIESHQGRNRMISLFKKIGYGSFHDSIKELGYSDFYRNWNKIVEIRNQVIHGNLEKGEEIDPVIIKSTIEDALELFSNLHNRYNEETIRYKYSVKTKKGIDADLDRLDRWSQGTKGNLDNCSDDAELDF